MIHRIALASVFALLTASTAHAVSVSVFSTDFNSGVPTEFSGITTTTGVQGYAGLGPVGNQFSGDMIHNNTAGNPASKTVLTLTGLPTHTSIDINFLLAVIDSWDGNDQTNGPDLFTVTVDTVAVFSETLTNNAAASYAPPSGVLLSSGSNLGFGGGQFFNDTAYDMGADAAFDAIPHTASTLTIEWFAGGPVWNTANDESWGIDNVEIILNGVPEPTSLALLGLGGLVALRRRR